MIWRHDSSQTAGRSNACIAKFCCRRLGSSLRLTIRSVPLATPTIAWLSRMNRRRLAFEQWRDAMLVASGNLDVAKIGGPSLALDDVDNHRRTLYATIHRRDMSPTLMVHDFPDPTQHSPARTSTVTALQGLYALNGPLLAQQSRRLVDRLRQEVPMTIAVGSRELIGCCSRDDHPSANSTWAFRSWRCEYRRQSRSLAAICARVAGVE